MLGETAAIFSPTLPFLCSRLGRRFYQKMLTQSKSKSGYLEKVCVAIFIPWSTHVIYGVFLWFHSHVTR